MAFPYAVSRNTAVHRTIRRLAVCAAPLFLCALPAMTAHGAPPPKSAPAAPGPAAGTPRVLQTDDNWGIYTTYFPAPGDREAFTKEAPVVILLHGDKQNRLVYEGPRGLATRLQQEGCAVITVDLRKHGQSTNVAQVGGDSAPSTRSTEASIQASDYRNMVEFDLEVVKRFIQQQHQAKKLNMRKLGIVAAGSSVGVAAAFADSDWNKEPYDDAPSNDMKTPRGQDVRAIVFLSPPARVKGLSLAESITDIRNPDWNIAFMTLYGKANRTDKKDAESLYKKLSGTSKTSADRMYLVPVNVPSRGTDLLGIRDIDTEGAICKFFKKHLFDLRDSEWRDRQSRLVRK
jgi:pimeloyl-ACP methyl ester carboxylesterase